MQLLGEWAMSSFERDGTAFRDAACAPSVYQIFGDASTVHSATMRCPRFLKPTNAPGSATTTLHWFMPQQSVTWPMYGSVY